MSNHIWKRYDWLGSDGTKPRKMPSPPCPAAAVGQVWHFPLSDTDLMVISRHGNSYYLAGDTEVIIRDEMNGDTFSTTTTDEYTAVPPNNGSGPGWLVAGPGAPWTPTGESDDQ